MWKLNRIRNYFNSCHCLMIRRILALMSKPEIIHCFTNFPASKENHALNVFLHRPELHSDYCRETRFILLDCVCTLALQIAFFCRDCTSVLEWLSLALLLLQRDNTTAAEAHKDKRHPMQLDIHWGLHLFLMCDCLFSPPKLYNHCSWRSESQKRATDANCIWEKHLTQNNWYRQHQIKETSDWMQIRE